MLSFFSLLLVSGIISSQIPASEIVKVIAILLTIPLTLYLSVKWSQNKSTWILNSDELIIEFSGKVDIYIFDDIDHIKSLTRSGGNLYVIHFKKKNPRRYWRNKLFTSADQNEDLHHALTNHVVEYYKM